MIKSELLRYEDFKKEVMEKFQKEKISIMEVVAIKLRQVFSNWIQCMLLVHSTTNQQH